MKPHILISASKISESGERLGKPLYCCKLIQPHRLFVVCGHTITRAIAHTQSILGSIKPLSR